MRINKLIKISMLKSWNVYKLTSLGEWEIYVTVNQLHSAADEIAEAAVWWKVDQRVAQDTATIVSRYSLRDLVYTHKIWRSFKVAYSEFYRGQDRGIRTRFAGRDVLYTIRMIVFFSSEKINLVVRILSRYTTLAIVVCRVVRLLQMHHPFILTRIWNLLLAQLFFN